MKLIKNYIINQNSKSENFITVKVIIRVFKKVQTSLSYAEIMATLKFEKSNKIEYSNDI